MAHYKFKSGVYFVSGALRGAILDTNTRNVYSVNEDAVDIVTGKTEGDEYWQLLQKAGLVEESISSEPMPELPSLQEITLKFVWFEIISDDCNESCVHCYADSMPPAHRKLLGLEVEDAEGHKPKLSYQQWVGLIDESFRLGCQRCQFIGGEPFLYKDGNKTVLDLAEYAASLGFEYVEIFTNGTFLTDEKISRIKNLGLRIALSIYSNEAEVHDRITQTPGSHSKTMEALKKLKSLKIPVRVATILMKQNEHTAGSTMIMLKDIGVGGRLDPLRPKGRGDNQLIKPSAPVTVKHGYKTKPNFQVTKQTLKHYSSGHSCLAGKITITDSGDVLPCIFSRNHAVGNVVVQDLETVLISSAMQQIWHTTKDNVMVCRDCEYRYVCFDCRPLSEAAAQGNADYLHAPYPRCTYNPYTGEWAKGVWRVDDSGKPWYDTSVEGVIRQGVG